jgi:hypothetical protein
VVPPSYDPAWAEDGNDDSTPSIRVGKSGFESDFGFRIPGSGVGLSKEGLVVRYRNRSRLWIQHRCKAIKERDPLTEILCGKVQRSEVVFSS